MRQHLLQTASLLRDYSPFYAALGIRANEWLAMRTLSVWPELQFTRYVHMQNDNTLVEGLAVLEGRSWSVGSGYRYGFQAQEEDAELWEGAVNYKYRVEDPRLGRFFSVDPLCVKYSYNSTYAFSENRLIDGVELEGLELGPIITFGNSSTIFEVGIAASRTHPIIEVITETSVPKNLPKSSGGNWWAAMVRGSQVHKEHFARWAKEGFTPELWLGRLAGRGNRVDGFKREGLIGILRELKPNNEWGRSAGMAQLERYLAAARHKYPEVQEWILELHLYEQAQVNGLMHVVVAGETLSSLAERYDTTVEDLMILNNIPNANEIFIGEELMVDFSIKDTYTPNIQWCGSIIFDSNMARQGDGCLVVNDLTTGQEYRVTRNEDGSYSNYSGK
jgi:RHS repeat-associated protein